jgi:ubiquinone biosynthesis protein
MEEHIGTKNISDIDIGAFFSDIATGALRHRIKMPPTYTMVFKAFMTVEGLGKNVAPELNFLEQLRPFIREVLIERYSPKRLLREGFEIIGGASRVMRELPLLGMQVVEEMARGNLQFRVQERSDERLLEIEHNRNVWGVRALGFFTTALCGTLAWDLETAQVLGMSVPSFIFYLLAVVFGIPLLFRAVTGRF